MSKQLEIIIYKDPESHIQVFLQEWLRIGTYQSLSSLHHKLESNEGKKCELYVKNDRIIIHGEIPSQSLMLIDRLSKSCEADKIIEGEFVGKGTQQAPDFETLFSQQNVNGQIPFTIRQFGKISTLSKTKMVILLILSLPLLLIMIPVAIIYMIIKVIMFKLNFK